MKRLNETEPYCFGLSLGVPFFCIFYHQSIVYQTHFSGIYDNFSVHILHVTNCTLRKWGYSEQFISYLPNLQIFISHKWTRQNRFTVYLGLLYMPCLQKYFLFVFWTSLYTLYMNESNLDFSRIEFIVRLHDV